MNAKKIMGAVLVALLAAALFVGAASAAVTAADGKTVFTFQDLDTATPAAKNLFEGTWVNGDMFVTISSSDYIVTPSANFVPGTYKNGENSIYVTTPAASFSAAGNVNSVDYIINNGGKAYMDGTFSVGATTVAGINVNKYQVTFPSGEIKTLNSISKSTLAQGSTLVKGTYKVQGIYAKENFKIGVDSNILLDPVVFTFEVVGSEDATLVASVDSAYTGDFLTLTIEGTVGEKYALALKGLTLNKDQFIGNGQISGSNGNYEVTMPNSGKVTIQVKVSATKDEATATLDLDKDVEVKIKIAAPVITATAGSATYFVGDIIKITGTTTADSALAYNFTIEGTNFKPTKLTPENGDDTDLSGKNWKAAFNTALVTEDGSNKKLDVGAYTVKVWNGKDVLATLVVSLKQPFISIVEAPEVVAQNTKAEFVINAEASANGIKAYFFGTNFFAFADEVDQDEDIKTQYTAILKKETTDNMSTGQYFAVFQHPMYDGKFNINATANGAFYLNTNGEALVDSGDSFLFKFNDRQTANAAQALCDALDSQNIDDMYVKYSFFIVGKDASFSISEIPSKVTKGTTITISGVDTANADATVVVEMVSTAFAAVPKEDVNAAAFVAVATTVAEDGTWEVTLDTSDLNVDEYAITVKIAEELKKSVAVNVVAAEEKPDTPVTPEQPEQPEQPEEPVAPATPGFGALAALAGLGAVAVLLLRRE